MPFSASTSGLLNSLLSIPSTICSTVFLEPALFVGPRLLTVFGTDRSRWTSAVELQSHSGIAPVTEKSGNSCWIHHRLACAKFVKQAFHEFADQSIRYSAWARAYYDLQRSRGKDHQAAVRALAYKWIRIIFRCWKDSKPYDEATYIQSLRRRGSPAIEKLP